jgi:hypothetical protein
MTEQQRIIGRVTKTAKTVVDECAKALRQESDKIDNEQYELADAISTVTRLVNIGLAGSTELGRIPLEERLPEKQLALGEYVSSVVRRMVSQSGTVAQAAANDIEGMAYTPSKWLESVTRLIDIGIAGGMEIAETIAAGPARFESQPVASDVYTAPASKDTRQLSIVEKSLKRDATEDEIATDKVSFDPPSLVPPNTEFRVLVNAAGSVSGVYKGTVRAGTDTVPVQIQL